MLNLLFLTATAPEISQLNMPNESLLLWLIGYLIGLCVMYVIFRIAINISDFCSRVNKLAKEAPKEHKDMLEQIDEIAKMCSDIDRKIEKISAAVEQIDDKIKRKYT